jgi:voltage-gated potassium channel
MARVSPVERLMSRFLSKPLSVRAAARVIVTATIGVVVIAGLVIHLFDKSDFPNAWLGMWWAVQTVTTVGYGDVVPRTVLGRIVAAVVMLQGIAFIAVVTAAITSSFVARAARERIYGQPHPELTDRQRMEQRFDDLERKVDQLLSERG